MAFTCCWRANAQESGKDKTSEQLGSRRSIRRDGDDLLAMQKMNSADMEQVQFANRISMGDDDPYFMEKKQVNGKYGQQYGQTSTDMRDTTISGMDDEAYRAVDEFMRSPRSYNRKATSPLQTSISSPNLRGKINTSQGSSSARLGNYKKTGVVFSKCFQMLCGNCGRRFTKIMVVEQTTSPTDVEQSVFDIQSLFNSSRNHELECPYCSKKAQIILSSQMLIGNQNQLDYPASFEKNLKGSKIAQRQGTMGGSPTTQGSLIAAENTSLPDEATEKRPQVMSVNPQQLKNSTKIARVLIIDENPIAPVMSDSMAQTRSSLRNNDTTGNTTAGVMDSFSDKKSLAGSLINSVTDLKNQAKPLLAYPEELHKATRDHCLGFNARIMKHLMKQKMQKNQTFLQTKCMDQNGRHRPGAQNLFMVKKHSQSNLQKQTSDLMVNRQSSAQDLDASKRAIMANSSRAPPVGDTGGEERGSPNAQHQPSNLFNA